jgi:tetratricopeptide (TPR) repeat protein
LAEEDNHGKGRRRMNLCLFDPNLMQSILKPDQRAEGNPIELVFDDEPLDRILYGIGETGPTPASYYAVGRLYLRQISEALTKKNQAAVIEACADLAACKCPISIGMCSRLAAIFGTIIPMVPNPVLSIDLRPLRPLLELIWEIALSKGNDALKAQIAIPLFRWFEHYGIYDEARRILSIDAHISADQGDRNGEAISLNNLGFEYLLEDRFPEALPYFDRAARLFEQTGAKAEQANSRANYLICMFQNIDVSDAGPLEAELQQLAELLRRRGFWQERKPLILLARIREKQGKIDEAIELVKRAIKSATGSGTRYPEEDAQYLGRLLPKVIIGSSNH